MMKKVFFYVLIAVFISLNANAANKLHVVQPGDTLWDLSRAHYKDPFLWGKIWMNNTYLNDPNLIFPGEIIEYTKYGITIYKKPLTKPKVKKKKGQFITYDAAVFYGGGKFYSDCGGGFCVWKKDDFNLGKLTYDRYNNLEVSSGQTVFIDTDKNILNKTVYVYRKIEDYYAPLYVRDIYVPIGEIKITKAVKPAIYKGIITKSRVEISQQDVVSLVYPFKTIKTDTNGEILGNVQIDSLELSDISLTPHMGYYLFFKTHKPFNKNIVGKTVYIDRVNESLPENTNIAKGIVVSQYKRYMSIFVRTDNNLKEMVDDTKKYVLR